jgi:hypothetical protein
MKVLKFCSPNSFIDINFSILFTYAFNRQIKDCLSGTLKRLFFF